LFKLEVEESLKEERIRLVILDKVRWKSEYQEKNEEAIFLVQNAMDPKLTTGQMLKVWKKTEVRIEADYLVEDLRQMFARALHRRQVEEWDSMMKKDIDRMRWSGGLQIGSTHFA
jgi:hypothetical protein